MDMLEKQLSSEILYTGKVVSLRKDRVKLPDGRTAMREVVEHVGGVCVAPLTDDGNLIFVRQYRYPMGEALLELPAGKMDPGENDPLVCGARELREETGVTAQKFTPLGRAYPSPGCLNEILYIFLAQGLSFGDQQPDDDEFFDIVRIPLEDAVGMVLSGEIVDAKTQIAILKTKLLLQGS